MTDPSQFLSADFSVADLTGWTIVDEGTIAAPSAWSIGAGKLRQDSNIYGPDVNSTDNRKGTYCFWNDPKALGWANYTLSAVLNTADDDGIGIIFRYQDRNNYYKLDLDLQRAFRKLFKVVNGVEATVANETGGYSPNTDMAIEIVLDANQITAKLNGTVLFGGPLADGSLLSGTVGLYSWGSQSLTFDNVQARPNADAALVPWDSDQDGLMDYVEDRSGDGLVGAGETASNNADTDGDGLQDGLEAAQWRSPLTREANIIWFTPLK